MSFDLNKMETIAYGRDSVLKIHKYKDAVDAKATIEASAYFNSYVNVNDTVPRMDIGDTIFVEASDDHTLLRVTAINPNVTTESYQIGSVEDRSITTLKIALDTILQENMNHDSTSGSVKIADTVYIVPTVQSSGTYRHYLSVDDGVVFNDTATGKITAVDATKTYIVNLECGRPVGQGMTGDSNDAVIKADYHNFAANDANSIIRGANISVRNRGAAADTGLIEGAMIGAQSKDGATVDIIRALTVVPENYATNADEFGGIDVVLKDEVGAATLRYGIQIRNIDASGVAAMGSALLISNTSTNGYTYGIDMTGSTLVYDIRLDAGMCVLSGVGAPGMVAPKGSLYLRTDGSTTNDRAYINTDASTTWTALTTAA